MYEHFGANCHHETVPGLNHSFATDLPGLPSDYKHSHRVERLARKPSEDLNINKFPFLNNCGIDAAGKLLQGLLPKLTS